MQNIPLDRLDATSLASSPGKDGLLYFVCQSGGRSKKACDAMLAAGFEKAINVDGGTVACEAAGLPVVRGRKTISLERQVRIAAGLLVLVVSSSHHLAEPPRSNVLAYVLPDSSEQVLFLLEPQTHAEWEWSLQKCHGISRRLLETHAKQQGF